jgi:hypothetical protein
MAAGTEQSRRHPRGDSLSRTIETGAALMFLAAASVGFTQTAMVGPELQVAISVYDYAHISTGLLAAAEEDARRVFRQAGIETVWATCFPKLEKSEPDGCAAVDANHLMLKILPRAIAASVRERSDVLGTAIVDEKGVGFYAYVFYDRVQSIAEERKLGHALLGDVLAHEIGHLLLGSNSHSVSGIMSAHWYGEELRRISEGAMLFAPSQSRKMMDRVSSRQLDLLAETRGTANGSARPSSTVPTFQARSRLPHWAESRKVCIAGSHRLGSALGADHRQTGSDSCKTAGC